MKSRKHLINYIYSAIRRSMMISRTIEFDNPITVGKVITGKVKKLLFLNSSVPNKRPPTPSGLLIFGHF